MIPQCADVLRCIKLHHIIKVDAYFISQPFTKCAVYFILTSFELCVTLPDSHLWNMHRFCCVIQHSHRVWVWCYLLFKVIIVVLFTSHISLNHTLAKVPRTNAVSEKHFYSLHLYILTYSMFSILSLCCQIWLKAELFSVEESLDVRTDTDTM